MSSPPRGGRPRVRGLHVDLCKRVFSRARVRAVDRARPPSRHFDRPWMSSAVAQRACIGKVWASGLAAEAAPGPRTVLRSVALAVAGGRARVRAPALADASEVIQ